MKKEKGLSRREFLNKTAMGGLALATVLDGSFLFSNRVAAAGLTAGREIQPLWESASRKNKIVVVSDLHFGIDDGFAETVHNWLLPVISLMNGICR